MLILTVFSYLSLLILLNEHPKVNAQTCGVANPQSLEDCTYDSSKNSICCIAKVSLIDKHETLCVYVPKSQIFITPFVNMMDIGLAPDNILMDINCGFKAGDIPVNEPYSICGVDPENETECFENSLPNATCCYIKNPDNSSVCLLNSGLYKSNDTYFGITVICGSDFIIASMQKLILVLIVIICFIL